MNFKTVNRNPRPRPWNYANFTNYTSITNLRKGQRFGISPRLDYVFDELKEHETFPDGTICYKAYFRNKRGKRMFTYVWEGWTVFTMPDEVEQYEKEQARLKEKYKDYMVD